MSSWGHGSSNGVQRRPELKKQETASAPHGDFVSSLIASYPSNLDPKTIEMRQSTGWIRYLSSMQLKELANRAEGYTLEQIQDARHSRFTTPIVSLIMLALGLPFVLDRIPAGVVAAGSKSLLVCGLVFSSSVCFTKHWQPNASFRVAGVASGYHLRTHNSCSVRSNSHIEWP